MKLSGSAHLTEDFVKSPYFPKRKSQYEITNDNKKIIGKREECLCVEKLDGKNIDS